MKQCRVDVDSNGQHQQLFIQFVSSQTKRGLFGRSLINALHAVTLNRVDSMPETFQLLIELKDVFEPSTVLIC